MGNSVHADDVRATSISVTAAQTQEAFCRALKFPEAKCGQNRAHYVDQGKAY